MSVNGGKPLLIGVSGQVGSQLLQLLGADRCLISARRPRSENQLGLDLSTVQSVADAEQAIGSHDVNLIYCIGGMTAVDTCEEDPELAFATNCRGPATLARLAAKRAIPFVYFSTEYIFDGYDGPYGEDDVAHPLSVYGKSKWEGEMAVLAACPDALVLRTTVVHGQDFGQKNYVYSLMRVLGTGKPMRVPVDQVSTPTYNRDLARATIGLAENGASGIYHVCGPERMNRMEFARKVVAFLGLDENLLLATSTKELGQKAPRPLSAGLSIDKLRRLRPDLPMRTLAESLQDCRDELKQFLSCQ